MKKLGKHFGDEVVAAGLAHLPVSWDMDTGEIHGRERLTPAEQAAADALIAAHNPDALPPAAAQTARYSKKLLFENMTDGDYDKWEMIEKQQNKRKARMFKEATDINESDASFPELRAAMAAALGESRVVELLAKARIA